MIPQQISINEWVFVAAVALVFGYLGWRRGLTVALYMLAGLVVGVVLADRLGRLMEPWINFTWKVLLALVRERAFSPEAMFKAAANQPSLITQDVQRMYVGILVFLFLVVLAFLIGQKRSAKAKSRPTTRIVAGIVGAVNGYLVAYFIFPRLITTPTTVITLSNANIRNLLRVQLTFPIVITVLIVITVGVLGAREGKPKGK
jgi:hypothetical protein